MLPRLKAEADDLSNADAREAALLAFKQLCQSVGRPCEPYVVPLLPHMLERLADKASQVRDAAMGASLAVVDILCPHAVELVLPGETGPQQQQQQHCIGYNPVPVSTQWLLPMHTSGPLQQVLGVCLHAVVAQRLQCRPLFNSMAVAVRQGCLQVASVAPVVACVITLCACRRLAAAVIFDAMEDSKKWQVKEGALRLLAALSKTAPSQVAACLPAIVPLISERMVDPREQVRRHSSSSSSDNVAASRLDTSEETHK